jgi:hypothetical protein
MALQLIEDMGVADIFSVRCGITTSGGQWMVAASGACENAEQASGPVASYTTPAVTVTTHVASGTTLPIGLAIQDCASGTDSYVGVLRKGTVIINTNGNAGVATQQAASNAAEGVAMCCDAGAAVQSQIGQAYVASASGASLYTIVSLNL